MTLQDKIERIDGWNDWSAKITERNGDTIVCEFQNYSPAGQDFSFYVWTDDDGSSLAHDIFDYYDSFDVSAEAYRWLDDEGHGQKWHAIRHERCLRRYGSLQGYGRGIVCIC